MQLLTHLGAETAPLHSPRRAHIRAHLHSLHAKSSTVLLEKLAQGRATTSHTSKLSHPLQPAMAALRQSWEIARLGGGIETRKESA